MDARLVVGVSGASGAPLALRFLLLAQECGLGVELMGKSSGITAPETWLTEVIRDNPAGQEEQMTPFILVRRLRDVG